MAGRDWLVLENLTRTLLAMWIVVAGTLWVIGGADFAAIQDRWALAGGLVGAVAGYYFGSYGVDQANARTATATTDGRLQALERAESDLEEIKADVSMLTTTLRLYAQVIDQENLREKVDELMEQVPP